MTKFGVKWSPPRPDDGLQRYPYRSARQAQGEALAAKLISPELLGDRSFEVVEEPDMLGPDDERSET